MSMTNMDHFMIDSSEDEENDILALRRRKVYRERINFYTFHREDFIERFRLRPSEAEHVLYIIGPFLKHRTELNAALAPQQQLLMTLHWLAIGCPLHSVGDMHGISKATVCRTVKRVCNQIVTRISGKVIRWPANPSAIALEFLEKGGFPCVCGAVDGTIINIQAPNKFEEQYVDRHGKHSINVMMICGADYTFYYVNARYPGSVHDARVLRNSDICSKFESGWRPFPGAVILGDSGYGLKSWLIPPLRQNPDDERERKFNVAHKRTRRLVENSYGILKNRFMCLKYLRLNPTFAAIVVITCATLHNIATKKDFMINVDSRDNDNSDELSEVLENAPPCVDGRQKVNELLNYFR